MSERRPKITQDGIFELIAGIREMSGTAQSPQEIEAFGTVLARLEAEVHDPKYPRRSRLTQLLHPSALDEVTQAQLLEQAQAKEIQKRIEEQNRLKQQQEEVETKRRAIEDEQRSKRYATEVAMMWQPDAESIASQTGWKIFQPNENTKFFDTSGSKEFPAYSDGTIPYQFFGINSSGELVSGPMSSSNSTFINFRRYNSQMLGETRIIAGIWNKARDTWGVARPEEDQRWMLHGVLEHDFLTTYVGFYHASDTQKKLYFKIRIHKTINNGKLEVTPVQPVEETR